MLKLQPSVSLGNTCQEHGHHSMAASCRVLVKLDSSSTITNGGGSRKKKVIGHERQTSRDFESTFFPLFFVSPFLRQYRLVEGGLKAL